MTDVSTTNAVVIKFLWIWKWLPHRLSYSVILLLGGSHLLMTRASRFKPLPIDLIPFPGNAHHKSHDRNLGGNRVSEHAFVQIILPLKVAEHCFGSLWVYVICQITARERFQLTSWNLAGEKFTDERLWLTGKFDVFVVSMAIQTIKYNLKISLLLSLHKIRSLDFPINLHTAYCHLKLIWPNFNRRVIR